MNDSQWEVASPALLSWKENDVSASSPRCWGRGEWSDVLGLELGEHRHPQVARALEADESGGVENRLRHPHLRSEDAG